MEIQAHLGLYDTNDIDSVLEVEFIRINSKVYTQTFRMKSSVSRAEVLAAIDDSIGEVSTKIDDSHFMILCDPSRIFIKVGISRIGSIGNSPIVYNPTEEDEDSDDEFILFPSPADFEDEVQSRAEYSVKVFGVNQEEVVSVKKRLYELLAKNRTNSIVWSFTTSSGEIQKKEIFVEDSDPISKEYYPWIKEDTVQEYYKNYLRSPESILLLTGIPGTGKTTFIRSMITENRLNADITYDERLINSDAFFLEFINNREKDVLIIEDADTLLYDREKERSTVLNKILNISDGLIKNVAKKIIFSTNITEIDLIDPALIRPGRCYDVMDFRKLSRDESQKVVDLRGINKELENRDYTLAEIFSSNNRTQTTNKRKMGF